MATAQQVTLYSQPIGASGAGTARLVCVGTLVTDAALPAGNNVAVEYFVETTGGNPSTRVAIGREDFLAIRQLRNLPTP